MKTTTCLFRNCRTTKATELKYCYWHIVFAEIRLCPLLMCRERKDKKQLGCTIHQKLLTKIADYFHTHVTNLVHINRLPISPFYMLAKMYDLTIRHIQNEKLL